MIGNLRVFDAHTHYFGRGFFTAVGKQLGLDEEGAAEEVARRLGWDLPAPDPLSHAARWSAELERQGVDRAVSIHTLPGDFDAAAVGIRAGAPRLVGYVMINPTVSADATSQFQVAVEEFGFRGLALFPAMFRFSMTDQRVYDLLDYANRRKLNVFVHCGVLKVGFRNKLKLPCPFDAMFASPLQLQKPAADFPGVNFIVPHLGSGMLRELLMVADTAPNIFTDTSGVAGWTRWLEDNLSSAQALRRAVAVLGAERILFGSDSSFFPRGWRADVLREQLHIFSEAELSPKEIAAIVGGNLDRLIAASDAACASQFVTADGGSDR